MKEIKLEDTPSKKMKYVYMAVDFNIALLINDIHDIGKVY